MQILFALYTIHQEDWSAKIIEPASINDLDEIALKVARDKFKEKSSRTSFFDEIDL